nr:MAG TPA: hypothetical protein [Caudoviricetes sp.]
MKIMIKSIRLLGKRRTLFYLCSLMLQYIKPSSYFYKNHKK